MRVKKKLKNMKAFKTLILKKKIDYYNRYLPIYYSRL